MKWLEPTRRYTAPRRTTETATTSPETITWLVERGNIIVRHALMKHLWRCLPNHISKFPNVNHIPRFCKCKDISTQPLPTVNLSFSIFISTALLPVHCQCALSATMNARKKKWSQNGHHFSNVYFQVMFPLPVVTADRWSLHIISYSAHRRRIITE